MATKKRQRTRSTPEPRTDLDHAMMTAWLELKAALEQALADGALHDRAGPHELAMLKTILTDHEMLGAMFFEAGWMACMSGLAEGIRVSVVSLPNPHDPATHRKIGRA